MPDESRGLFSIGEFSRICGITVKSLRFYHDEKLLIPTLIDPGSGYRYYAENLIERARAIVWLRGLEFSIDEIRELLKHADDEGKILAAIENHKSQIEQRIRALRKVVRSLDQFINEERQANMQNDENVQE